MKKLFVLLFLVSIISESYAIDCPKDENETLTMITESGICYDAAEIARTCANTTVTEIIYSETASDLCSDGFREQMTPETKKAYQTLENLCDKNASRATGVYYQALLAMCKLDIDVLMNSLHNTAQ